MGPAPDAVAHFVALGQSFSAGVMNPADYVIESINALEFPENESSMSEEIKYAKSEETIQHDRSFFSQVGILLRRNYLQQFRRYDNILYNLLLTGKTYRS